MMTWNPFLAERSVPLFGALYAGENIKLIYEGDRAFTDGNVVHLPRNIVPPADASSDDVLAKCEDYRTLNLGLTVHEVLHVKKTDFAIPAASPTQHVIRNVFEDIRIEDEGIAEMPGTRRFLDGLVRVMRRWHGSTIPPDDAPLATLFERYLLERLYCDHRGIEELRPDLDIIRERLAERIGRGPLIRLNALLGESIGLSGTQAAHDLAIRVVGMLEEEAQEPPASQSPEAGEGEGGACAGGGSGVGEGDGTPDAQQRESLRQLLQAAAGEFAADRTQDVVKLLNEIADDAKQAGATEQVATPSAPESGQSAGSGGAAWDLDPQGVNYPRILGTVGTLSYAVGTRLEAKSRAATKLSPAGRRLDPRKLATHRIDPRIFRRKRIEARVDTAVQLLLDRSGSMRGNAIEVARDALTAAALAIQDVPGVSVAASAFPNDAGEASTCLRFGDRVNAATARDFALTADGGTPLDRALWSIALPLLARREPRKLLVVLTDGYPDNLPQARSALDTLRDCGVEVIALGILTDAVRHLSSNHAVLKRLEDLPDALLGTLERSLETAVAA